MLKIKRKEELRKKSNKDLYKIILEKKQYLLSRIISPQDSNSMKDYKEARNTIAFIKTILTEKGTLNDNT